MMEVWQELKRDNIPNDIITGEYEFMTSGKIVRFQEDKTDLWNLVLFGLCNNETIVYRGIEPLFKAKEIG